MEAEYEEIVDELAPKRKAYALWGVDTFDTIDENPYFITETDYIEDARQYAKTFKGRYDWIIIVPKEPGPREIVDLNPEINEIVEEFMKSIPKN